MVDISSVQQDSIVVQSLQQVGGTLIDASNNFFVNTSILFMGNTVSSVLIKPSGVVAPLLELDGVLGNVSINTTSFMMTTSTANLYLDVTQANFPGDVSITGSLILTGSFVANGDNGNTGDVLVSDGSIAYWSSAANNATYAFGKTESNLNVNNSLTSNNASYLGGIAAAQYAYANQVGGGSVNTNAQYTWNNTQTFANSVTINNDKRLYFQTVNTSSSAAFVQQSDDNFVFYTTNTSYGTRAVYSIYANSNSSEFSFQTPVRFNANVTVLVANGTTGSPGQILASDGTNVYWVSPGAASVNTAAQFTWSNTHTFSANVSFTGNGIGLTSNTGALYLAGTSDASWRIGRNTGSPSKFFYSNVTLDILAGGSNLEGITFGQNGANTYLETGANGTFTRNPIYVGNSSVNVTINSTSFTGTSNNASYLGGTVASGYQTTAGLSANVATLAANAATYLNGKTESNLNVNNSLTSNNASYLGGTVAANFVQNTDSRTLSGNLNFTGANTTFSGNVTIASTGELIITNGAGIYANGSLGTTGQVLTTNGSSVYWSTASGGGGFTNGQSISVSNLVITGSVTANSTTGTDSQVLTTNGTAVYWSSQPSIGLLYALKTVLF